MTSSALHEKALRTNQWPLVEKNGLTLVCSPMLSKIDSLRHAFTTRLGGATAPPLDSFNLGRHWNTEESKVDAMNNRRILCQTLSVDADRLTVPGQQHTTNIFLLDGDFVPSQSLASFDSVATNRAMQPILLHFADCVPVILFDPKTRALCVVHAGWRGTAGGIVSKSVSFLESNFGSRPLDIVAAVGPAIGSCCYETGGDVAEKLASTVRSDAGMLIVERHGKAYPDLKAINAMQLLESGVEQVDVTAWCTACHPEIFYSHRQSGGQTGRQGAIACID